jgi:hypothetical protein
MWSIHAVYPTSRLGRCSDLGRRDLDGKEGSTLGPLEEELRQFMQRSALASPEILSAQVEGRAELDAGEAVKVAFDWIVVLSKCVSRLGREVDELRAQLSDA